MGFSFLKWSNKDTDLMAIIPTSPHGVSVFEEKKAYFQKILDKGSFQNIP